MPLSHIKVIDLTRARSGPTAVRQLADWGADVIMVEPPGNGDEFVGGRDNGDFQNLHRNKRSIVLNLKREDHREVLYDLVRTADVLVENYRPNVKHRLGIDYDRMHAINPRMVYASISGFGQTGPNADRPGVDQIMQGYAGLASVTGMPGGEPVRTGYAVTDTVSGLYCAIAVLTALVERQVSGEGRWVRTSLLEAGIALLDFQATRWLVDGVVPKLEGNHHPTGNLMGLFPTADGHVNLGVMGDANFARFARIVGREDWLSDPRYADGEARVINCVALRVAVGEALSERPSGEWVTELNAAGFPCGPVNSIDQTFADPQVRHVEMTRKVTSENAGTLELVSQPFRVSGYEFTIRSAAPPANAHAQAVLSELGYSQDRIAQLLCEGVPTPA